MAFRTVSFVHLHCSLMIKAFLLIHNPCRNSDGFNYFPRLWLLRQRWTGCPLSEWVRLMGSPSIFGASNEKVILGTFATHLIISTAFTIFLIHRRHKIGEGGKPLSHFDKHLPQRNHEIPERCNNCHRFSNWPQLSLSEGKGWAW